MLTATNKVKHPPHSKLSKAHSTAEDQVTCLLGTRLSSRDCVQVFITAPHSSRTKLCCSSHTKTHCVLTPSACQLSEAGCLGALRHKGFSLMHTLHTHSSWQCFTQEQLHTWAQEKDLQNTWFCNTLYYQHRIWCAQIPAGSLVTWNELSTHSNHQELLITYFCNYTGQLSSAGVSQSQSNKKWLLVRLEQKNWL